jgi:hypothetical protein
MLVERTGVINEQLHYRLATRSPNFVPHVLKSRDPLSVWNVMHKSSLKMRGIIVIIKCPMTQRLMAVNNLYYPKRLLSPGLILARLILQIRGSLE